MQIFNKLPKAGFVLVVASIIIFELVVLFKLFPRQWQETSELLRNKQEVGSQVMALSKALIVLKSVDQKELARQLSVVNAALPSQKKTSGLVAGLSNLTSGSGVSFIQVDFAPGLISTSSAESAVDTVIPGTKVHRLDANLSIGADLTQLATFLGQIQKVSQLIGISQISYSGASARQQTAQLALQVYYEPEAEDEIDWGKLRVVSTDEQKVIQMLSGRDVFILPGEPR